MTGVGGENATGFLDPVKRQRVGAEPVDPELLFEQSPERLGLGVNVLRSVPFSKGAGELAGGAAGGIDIALHLAQRDRALRQRPVRSEEHTSELQSLLRISYGVFCLKKKKKTTTTS